MRPRIYKERFSVLLRFGLLGGQRVHPTIQEVDPLVIAYNFLIDPVWPALYPPTLKTPAKHSNEHGFASTSVSYKISC